MTEATLSQLQSLVQGLEKLVQDITPRQAELRDVVTLHDSEFFAPLKQMAEQAKSLLESGKGELVEHLQTFHAERMARLDVLKGKLAERDAAARSDVPHFRDSDHGMTEERIDKLVEMLLDEYSHKAKPSTSDWTNW